MASLEDSKKTEELRAVSRKKRKSPSDDAPSQGLTSDALALFQDRQLELKNKELKANEKLFSLSNQESYVVSAGKVVPLAQAQSLRPYVCPDPTCNARYRTQAGLDRHAASHTVNPSLQYPCGHPNCGKVFNQPGNLALHERTHSGNKPYRCPVPDCNKSFVQSGQLQAHVRAHVQERPYGCIFCDKKFVQHCHLTQHIRIHTGEKPYRCELCGEEFRQANHVSSHLKKKH